MPAIFFSAKYYWKDIKLAQKAYTSLLNTQLFSNIISLSISGLSLLLNKKKDFYNVGIYTFIHQWKKALYFHTDCACKFNIFFKISVCL